MMEHAKPENADEKFVQMFAEHERDLRAFVRSMGLDWSAVDDVIQMVSLVMWRKWHEFDVDSSRRKRRARNEVGAVHERITKFVVHDDWHRIDDIWFCSSDNVFFGEDVRNARGNSRERSGRSQRHAG